MIDNDAGGGYAGEKNQFNMKVRFDDLFSTGFSNAPNTSCVFTHNTDTLNVSTPLHQRKCTKYGRASRFVDPFTLEYVNTHSYSHTHTDTLIHKFVTVAACGSAGFPVMERV